MTVGEIPCASDRSLTVNMAESKQTKSLEQHIVLILFRGPSISPSSLIGKQLAGFGEANRGSATEATRFRHCELRLISVLLFGVT